MLPPRKYTPSEKSLQRCNEAIFLAKTLMYAPHHNQPSSTLIFFPSESPKPIHQLGNDVRKQNEGLKPSDDGRDDIPQRATHGKLRR
ncbi:hypothetical protein CDAR_253491 [Caerostris darwini]|uniref:Uncharacterized protein n=1 Tax=Caerostris darwini TaxID=1538125 RepID=A0AAV4MJ78_9ARAC|nr:hypothetical protein CDAR_253491 [Caerostris darwini]